MKTRRRLEMRAITNFKTMSGASTSVSRIALSFFFSVAFLPLLAYSANPIEPVPVNPPMPGDPGPRAAADRSGTLQTRDGLTLHLTADLGSVRIVALEPGAPPVVRYTAHIETDVRAPLAQSLLDRYSLTAKTTAYGVEIVGASPSQAGRSGANAQFYVQFEVAVPASYSLDVNTGVGDIETQDIGGTASLITEGGNIRTGRIGLIGFRNAAQGHPIAKLSTQGGHIQVQDITGNLDAFTAGGHIVAGNIFGDAVLRSGGGHIRAGQISGRAQLETDGGNTTLQQAGSFVSVRTGGGQIDFGEVRGSVRAQTGGGGIRIITVSGPMEVESNGGSICLTRVAGAVQAATAGGTIQAWINPDATSSGGKVKLAGASQLASGNGDIAVFLPRNLAANIEAIVTSGDSTHIEADPAIHLAMQAAQNSGPASVRALATLNGGGAPLKLKTASGTIRLHFLDSQTALRESLIREQEARLPVAFGISFENNFPNAFPNGAVPSMPPPDASAQENKPDWFDSWMRSLERALTGALREDPTEFQKRLSY